MIKWTAPPQRPFLKDPLPLAALGWLFLAGMAALLAPYLAPAGPLAGSSTRSLLPPGSTAWLGTDLLGRDVFSRLVWGARWSLGMAAGGLAVSVGLGLPVGLLAGAFGGRLDAVLMRLVDTLLAFPGLLLAMAVVSLLGPGIGPVAVAVGIAAAPGYARVVRTAAADVRTRLYVEAAFAVGCKRRRVLRRYILPNALSPVIAFAATQLGWILLNGAALNFLGLGVAPGTPEWGAMLVDGRAYLRGAPWVSTFPGLALTLTVLAATLLGDRLQRSLQRG
ncbi:MAG: ABC transporter permease [Chloroflexi bacterium]|nr:MAG: ABC transporter permease [Chloroflexota bacterium]